MTSEIDGCSSDPILECYPEMDQIEEEAIVAQTEAATETHELIPDWRVREMELKAQRELIVFELKRAVTQGDMEAFQRVFNAGEELLYSELLAPVYAHAVHEASDPLLKELEAFLHAQEVYGGWSYLEEMVGNMEDPIALERLVKSEHISQECINVSLSDYFEESAIYGDSDDPMEGREGELPHRLELAQILIDHGADLFDPIYDPVWDLALLNEDIKGLQIMINHPNLNVNEQKKKYMSTFFDSRFVEKFDIPAFWGGFKEGLRKSKSLCTILKSFGLVPTDQQIVERIEKDQSVSLFDRTFMKATLLPFIDHKVEGLTRETETKLVMDFFSYYIYGGLFNSFIFQWLVEPTSQGIIKKDLDHQIIAERIVMDALKTEFEIPAEHSDDLDVDENYYNALEAHDLCTGLITKGYGYNNLIQYPRVKEQLLKTQGGEDFLKRFEAFYEELSTTFGPLPWTEDPDPNDKFAQDVVKLARKYFTT
ncbi:MAG: hypothetical protein K1060chlam2_00989 [Chlamydiae bacterium]|nr:hypothetical protein [Chlamydiota bacterium]